MKLSNSEATKRKSDFKHVPPIDITHDEVKAVRAAADYWKAIADAAEGLLGSVAILKKGQHPIFGYDLERTLRTHKLLDKEQLDEHVRSMTCFLDESERQMQVLRGHKPEELRPEQLKVLKSRQA